MLINPRPARPLPEFNWVPGARRSRLPMDGVISSGVPVGRCAVFPRVSSTRHCRDAAPSTACGSARWTGPVSPAFVPRSTPSISTAFQPQAEARQPKGFQSSYEPQRTKCRSDESRVSKLLTVTFPLSIRRQPLRQTSGNIIIYHALIPVRVAWRRAGRKARLGKAVCPAAKCRGAVRLGSYCGWYGPCLD